MQWPFPGKTLLSTQFSNERYAAAKYLLRPLLGYVKADVIEEKLDTILTMVDDEVVQGAYINNEDDYILLTTRSIYWKETGKEGRHFPYRQIDDLEIIRSEELHLLLRLTLKNAERISIPLLNDRFENNFNVPALKKPASPENLEDLAKNYLLPLDKVPEICRWILKGALDKKMLARYDIRLEELSYPFLYHMLDGLSGYVAPEKTSTIDSAYKNRCAWILKGLHTFAGREELVKQGKSEAECPEGLLGIYINNEESYLIVETTRITEYRLSSAVTIDYREIESFEYDSPGGIALGLKDGSVHILPVENCSDDIEDTDIFLEFLDCILNNQDIHEVCDLFSLETFLDQASQTLPGLESATAVLVLLDNDPFVNALTRSVSDYRLLALLLTEPYY